jgi:hypothetical protein
VNPTRVKLKIPARKTAPTTAGMGYVIVMRHKIAAVKIVGNQRIHVKT